MTSKEKAQELNSFFKRVFTEEDTRNIPTFQGRHVDEPLIDVVITEDGVLEYLQDLNIAKSTGPDNISPRFLRDMSQYIAGPLTIIFRKSIDEGNLPEDWKVANITPVYKNKGNKHHSTNYRPVSLTSVVCKILEKIVRKEILNHMKRNSLFAKEQHGFLEGRSCITNLLETLDVWTRISDDKGIIDCVYLDFKKAFDSVPHQRLLTKVKGYQIRGKIFEWISSFLTGRKQRVIVDGESSTWEDMSSGVPQGSVLGPILFVIYINDLPDAVDSQIKMFADDTKIYRRIDSNTDYEMLQHDIENLQTWTMRWQMQFHPDKCKTLHVMDPDSKRTYKMDNNGTSCVLEPVHMEKDLGVTTDDLLAFDKQSQESVKKAQRILITIRRTFTFIDEETMLQLYKPLVRSRLEYGVEIWSPSLKRNIREVEAIQRRATKMIPSLKDLPYSERLKKLQLPTLVYRRKRGEMIQTYKYLHAIYDCKADVLFKRNRDDRTRGHSLKLFKERVNTSTRANFFSSRIIDLWNSLPEDVVTAPSVNAFKSRLDKHWENVEWLYDFEAEN